MTSFPLRHKKISNEHVMTLIFLVMILYMMPYWFSRPESFLTFIGLVTFALLIDIITNMLRLKSIKCGVSAALTAAIIMTFYPGVSFFQGLVSIIIALVIFKYAFGSTGENIFNPAVTGILFLNLVTKNSFLMINHPVSYLAMLLMLVFVYIRPFSGLGLILGFIASRFFGGDLTISTIFTSGILIWSSIIVTDPVTVSSKVSVGLITFGLGFLVWTFSENIMGLTVMILVINLLSYLLDMKFPYTSKHQYKTSRLKSPYKRIHVPDKKSRPASSYLEVGNILEKIKRCEVKGLGGGAYSTYDKLLSFMVAHGPNKTIIINAAECDPGLVHDKWLLKTHMREIRVGINLVKKCTGEKHLILASKVPCDFNNLVLLKDSYPIGEERQLIKEVLQVNIKHTEIPSEKGILVLNLQTVLSIYKAVCFQEKSNYKYITIGNLITKEAFVKAVRIGSPIHDYIENHEGQLFMGTFMQSRPVNNNELIDVKTNFIGLSEFPYYKNSFCSKCDSCDRRCPSKLPVRHIVGLIEKGHLSKLKSYDLSQCLSCGLCSYTCLAGKDICSMIQVYK